MKSPCLSVLQLSDLHILPSSENTLLGVKTESYFHAVLNHAFKQRTNYDLLLLTGDLAQSPCSASYDRILHKLQEYNLPTLCLAGNHDDYSLMQNILNTSQVSCRKQTYFEKWQIILLNSQVSNSAVGYLEQSELNFLEKCLANRKDLFALIAVHHHCLPTNSVWLDTMQIENSEAFLEIVARYSNARVITTGHLHQEMNKKLGDVSVLGTPSTCFQFALNSGTAFKVDNTPPGYRIVDLYNDGSVITAVKRIDSTMEELELVSNGH